MVLVQYEHLWCVLAWCVLACLWTFRKCTKYLHRCLFALFTATCSTIELHSIRLGGPIHEKLPPSVRETARKEEGGGGGLLLKIEHPRTLTLTSVETRQLEVLYTYRFSYQFLSAAPLIILTYFTGKVWRTPFNAFLNREKNGAKTFNVNPTVIKYIEESNVHCHFIQVDCDIIDLCHSIDRLQRSWLLYWHYRGRSMLLWNGWNYPWIKCSFTLSENDKWNDK